MASPRSGWWPTSTTVPLRPAALTMSSTAAPAAIVKASGWPDYKGAVVVVGHQPDLGRVVAYLLGASGSFSVKKGALWWMSNRVRDEKDQVVVRAVVSPDLL